MDLTRLRQVIRSLVRDQRDSMTPWRETHTLKRLSRTERTSVRALERHLRRANGDIEILLPTNKAAEWC